MEISYMSNINYISSEKHLLDIFNRNEEAKPVILYYFSKNNNPSRSMKMKVEEIAKNMRTSIFCIIDSDRYQDSTMSYLASTNGICPYSEFYVGNNRLFIYQGTDPDQFTEFVNECQRAYVNQLTMINNMRIQQTEKQNPDNTMNGQMNGQMNPQTNGYIMNPQMNGQINPQMNGQMNGQMNPQMNGQMNPQMITQANGYVTNGQVYYDQTTGQINGQINSQANGYATNGQIYYDQTNQTNNDYFTLVKPQLEILITDCIKKIFLEYGIIEKKVDHIQLDSSQNSSHGNEQIMNTNANNQLVSPNMNPQMISSNTPSQMISSNTPSQMISSNAPQMISSNTPSQMISSNAPQMISSNVPSQMISSNAPQMISSNVPSQMISSNVPSQMISSNTPSQMTTHTTNPPTQSLSTDTVSSQMINNIFASMGLPENTKIVKLPDGKLGIIKLKS
jgi:hypothetical protein